jgi:hypothetical protein
MTYAARHGSPGKGHRSPKRYEPISCVEYVEILKDNYNGWRHPWWAKLSYRRGWMSSDAYYATEMTERDEAHDLKRLMYADFPLFKMLPKDSALGTS